MNLGLGVERWLIGTAIVVVVLVGTYQTGYWRGWNASQAQWKVLKAEMELASKIREDQLRAQGEDLAAQLKAAQTRVQIRTVETIRYVRVAASKTNVSLTPDIVAELNRNSQIRETVQRDGEPAQTTVLEPTKPNTGAASEAAVAEWIAVAQAAHESCRQQVAALADWIRAATVKPTKESK